MEYWKNIKVKTFEGKEKFLLDFTQEELIYEKVKCATDPIHVIETYFHIFDQTRNKGKGEIVPFILFPFQRDLVRSYEKNRFNITNKYRQAGISTITCAYLATYIAFNSNRSVAIVANKLETARDELMKDVTDFIDMLPPFLHPKISGKDSATHKKYSNGSQVKAFATNSLRGYTPTFLFWDEAAWCDNGEDFWTGTLPTLSTGGNAALVSCVTKDTMVWTDNGLIELNELIDHRQKGGYFVNEYEVLGRYKRRNGSIIKNNGFLKTKKILTEHVSLEGTLIHKLWAYNNKSGKIGYTHLNKINKEYYVALQYGSKSFGNFDTIKYLPHPKKRFSYYNFKITKKFAKLIALVYNKGNVHKGTRNRKPYISVQINNITEYDKNLILDFLNEYKETYPTYNIKENDYEFIENNFISHFQSINYIFYFLDMDFIGVNNIVRNRPLTKFIKKFKGDILFEFAKECINQIEDKKIFDDHFMVKINTILMGRQLQQILLNWGVVCSYNDHVDLTGKNQGDRYLSVNLKYEDFLEKENYDVELFDQYLPLGIMHNVRETFIKNELDLPFGHYTKLQLLNIVDKVRDLLIEDDIIFLDRILAKDIYWSKVYKTIKGYNSTYDFSLPKDKDDFWANSVIYNGILGHQTPNGLDPVFYKTFNNAKNKVNDFTPNELHWYLDPRYSIGLKWKRKNDEGVEIIKTEDDPKKYKRLILNGWKPWSPWFESMASQFNFDKKRIAQELECVVGETIVTIKNNETGIIENIKIQDLYDRINKEVYSILNHNNEFVYFDGIYKKETKETIKILTKNHELETSKSHKLITINGEKEVQNLLIGEKILTKNGYQEIIDLKLSNNEKNVYDLVNVGLDSLYLTNGVVSHNCSFLGSGNNFIDESNIRKIEEGQVCDPIKMEYDDFFWIWEEPIKDKSYVMTVDVSTGAGDDYSTIIILKQESTHLEQVAEFKHKVSPDALGIIANDYGKRYNNAFAIVDITGGIGAMTVKEMLDLGYYNMYYTVNRHEPTKDKLSDYLKEDENGKTLVPGFVITTSNRGMVLTEMKRAIEADEVVIKSYRLISEFKTFITTPNSRIADHRRSFNDDLIIALAMGIYVFSYDIKSVGVSIEKTKRMLSAITTNTSDHKTGNGINDNKTTNPSNPYVANGWLFRGLKGFN